MNIKYILIFGLLGVGLFQAANAQAKELIFCIGDHSERCPVAARKHHFDCGVNPNTVAKDFCTTNEQVGEYYVYPLSSNGGNRCGYIVYKVECKSTLDASKP